MCVRVCVSQKCQKCCFFSIVALFHLKRQKEKAVIEWVEGMVDITTGLAYFHANAKRYSY